MKTQEHNKGELAELTVKIEAQLVKDLETMAKNSGMPVDELVTIAVKRFRSSHADYMGIKLDYA
jgi:fructose-1,6-bisphosphatase/sedoheptulose 1,7-bisphosphatase-like protein